MKKKEQNERKEKAELVLADNSDWRKCLREKMQTITWSDYSKGLRKRPRLQNNQGQ